MCSRHIGYVWNIYNTINPGKLVHERNLAPKIIPELD
jgi:hypothetical protein